MSQFTIADVLAWARTKPAGETYDYCGKCGPCAIEQFLMETGRASNPQLGGNLYADGAPWTDNDGKRQFVPPSIASAANNGHMPAFGEFVARLEALCPEPVSQAGWAAIDAYLTDIDAVSADKQVAQ